MKQRALYLSGEFCNPMAMGFLTGLEALEAESSEDVYVFIDSYGGSVPAMFAIIDAMDRSPCDMVTIVNGKAMSAGAFTLVSGTPGKRLAMPNAQIMFHEPLGCAEVSKRGLEPLGHIRDMIFHSMTERLGKTEDELEAVMAKDFYLMPQEALERGYIDGIVGTGNGLVV